MAQHTTETQWMGKMQFNSLVNEHVIIMDAPGRGGGDDSGPIPKPFILTALSGCAGMELVNTLKQKQIELSSLSIKANGQLTTEAPYYYTSIHVVFEIYCAIALESLVKNTVHDVMTSICGVSYMLQKVVPIKWEIIFN